ncbi:DNA-3-methyladenine glycosylase family protein [Oceanobacillus timonensis]|uniref:DNA-3-methyladenine glycosylase family protein n=1 Tax=Oceanobacillus timonensis TaxID=1926285 RepID=UPI0009B9798B|nr:DNA-3-methyladenine glycosylase [Oceanobacillus timonensis]
MRTWEDKKNHIVIKAPEAFDFKVNLGYLQREPNECMYEIEDDKITRVIEINHIRTLVRISAADNDFLDVEFLANTKPELLESKEAIVHYICEWFDLDNDIIPFYEMGLQDPLLKQPIEKFYGLRNMGLNDLFEALCWGILGQQINLKFAYTLKRQFVEKFGESFNYEGKKYWVFPSFDKIAELSTADMADIKMTSKKKEYIIDVAKRMKNGHLSKEQMLDFDDFKQAEKELIRIRGIGPWTANYVCMRCLRYPTAFPMDDVGLMNAMKLANGMERKPTKEEIRELASEWENWEAYATFYLWRLLY